MVAYYQFNEGAGSTSADATINGRTASLINSPVWVENAGNDFTANTQTLSFAQGETTKTFTVQTTQDLLPETDETFTATLTTPTNGATISTSTAKGTIIDDDNPRISLAIAPASVFEDGITNLVYTFTRTGITTSALSVNYNVSGKLIGIYLSSYIP